MPNVNKSVHEIKMKTNKESIDTIPIDSLESLEKKWQNTRPVPLSSIMHHELSKALDELGWFENDESY